MKTRSAVILGLTLFLSVQIFTLSYAAAADGRTDSSLNCVPAKVKSLFVKDCQGELGADRFLDSASGGREALPDDRDREERRCLCLANGFPVEQFAKPPTCRVRIEVVQAFLRNPNGKLRCR